MNPTRAMARTARWLVAAWLLAVPAAAQDHRTDILASGERLLPYYTYGSRLVNMLPTFRVRNQATAGSSENLEMLADGRATLGFAQADAYSLALRRSPERYGSLTVVGRLVDECVFIAHRRKGPVLDLAGLGQPLEGREPKIAVGDAGSGMASTWELLSTLDPTLAEAEVVQRGGVLALNQLSIGMLHAVGWVSDPRDLDHVMLRAVRAAPALALLTIDEKFAHTLETGTVVYESRTVDLSPDPEGGGAPLQTVCTMAGVFARKGANPRLVEAVSRVLSLQREALVRRE